MNQQLFQSSTTGLGTWELLELIACNFLKMFCLYRKINISNKYISYIQHWCNYWLTHNLNVYYVLQCAFLISCSSNGPSVSLDLVWNFSKVH